MLGPEKALLNKYNPLYDFSLKNPFLTNVSLSVHFKNLKIFTPKSTCFRFSDI